MTTLVFKVPAEFLGRNGTFTATGIATTIITDHTTKQQVICLEPVTSRNLLGRCRIEIPVSQWDEFDRLVRTEIK